MRTLVVWRVAAAFMVMLVGASCAATPDVTAPEAIVQTFVKNANSADRSYHADFRMHSEMTGPGIGAAGTAYEGRLSVAGPNRVLAAIAHIPDVPIEDTPIEVALVNGRFFSRESVAAGWQAEQDPPPLIGIDPLAGLTTEGLEYVDPETAGGGRHLLRARDPVAVASRVLADAIRPGAEVTIAPDSAVEHVVDDDGRPVSSSMRLAGQTLDAGGLRTFVVRLDYTYSAWGEQIIIEQPAR